jgi:anti-sigma-K factor RskA
MYDDDRDALAAEYVLGTLSADERDQAEALLVIDPGFAEIVRVWERRLGELNVMVEAVEPPPDVWDRIKTEVDGAERHIAAEIEAARPANEQTAPAAETSLLPTIEEATSQIAPETPAETMPEVAGEPAAPTLDFSSTPAEDSDATPPEDADDSAAVAALASSLLPPDENTEAQKPPSLQPTPAPAGPKIERSAEVVYLAREARRWRGFTVAMSAIAAVLAVYIAVGQFAPGLLPMGRLPQSAATPPGSRLVAVLQQEPTAPAFLLTVDPQNRTMTVRRVTATADQGRSYELWLIPNNNPKPRSLGLVGADEFTTRALPADFDLAALRAASYAVSLEPAGGSPSGTPTGPVLFTGKMVESVPAATAPKI